MARKMHLLSETEFREFKKSVESKDIATQTDDVTSPLVDNIIHAVKLDPDTHRILYPDGTLGSNINDMLTYVLRDKSGGRPPDLHRFKVLASGQGEEKVVIEKSVSPKLKPWIPLP